MESWTPWRRARRGPLPDPGLLGLILLPWTLPLAGAGTRSSPPLCLAHITAAFIRRAANSPDPSLGICWLRLNIADFTGEAFGDREMFS